jgi:hypothetical protein
MPTPLDTHITEITADGDTDLPTSIGIRYGVSFAGGFGGGTIQVQHLNNGTGIPYDNGEFTGVGGCWFLAMDTTTRINMTGSTNPTVTARLVALKR